MYSKQISAEDLDPKYHYCRKVFEPSLHGGFSIFLQEYAEVVVYLWPSCAPDFIFIRLNVHLCTVFPPDPPFIELFPLM